jgi:hypothetical protein
MLFSALSQKIDDNYKNKKNLGEALALDQFIQDLCCLAQVSALSGY